jgi:hypothetical protein
MQYHKDRFEDYSLIVLEGQKWVAVLPANVVGYQVFSHQGLTYGGLVYNEKVKLAAVIEIFKAVLRFLNDNVILKLLFKTLPSIYHQKPSEEVNYALFLANAQLVRRDTLAVLDLTKKNSLTSGRKESVKKGVLNKFEVKEENEFEKFWNEVLIPNLNQKYKAKPVHDLKEIIKLKALFPENIRQFNVYQDGIIVAGTTIFESVSVAHSQYISGHKDKNDMGSLDFLHHYLLTEVFKHKHYFDFGISNENQGRKLNLGLSFWKESFGSSTIVQDFYEVESANFNLL